MFGDKARIGVGLQDPDWFATPSLYDSFNRE